MFPTVVVAVTIPTVPVTVNVYAMPGVIATAAVQVKRVAEAPPMTVGATNGAACWVAGSVTTGDTVSEPTG